MAKTKGLYKRGQTWWLRYAGPDKKIRYESSGTSSYREAQSLLTQRRRDVIEGKDPTRYKAFSSCTFAELSVDYLKWCERQKSYPSKKKFIKHLVSVFGNMQLKDFTTMMVENWQSDRLKINKPSTVNRHLEVLKHSFGKAFEWEMIDEDSSKRVRRVKNLKESNSRLRYLSKEDCQLLIDSCLPHLRPIVITALNTGMRKEEILSLEWDKHIDLVHGFILLDVTKNGDRREVPINNTVRNVLENSIRRIDSLYVFIDKDGNRYKDVSRSFKSACRKGSIKDFRFHDLRHTFASQLIMSGADLTTVRELLGHKTLTMTLRYAHLAPSHKVKALEMLETALNDTSTIQKLYNPQKKELTHAG